MLGMSECTLKPLELSTVINVEMYSKHELLKKSPVTWISRHYINKLLCNIINNRGTLKGVRGGAL